MQEVNLTSGAGVAFDMHHEEREAVVQMPTSQLRRRRCFFVLADFERVCMFALLTVLRASPSFVLTAVWSHALHIQIFANTMEPKVESLWWASSCKREVAVDVVDNATDRVEDFPPAENVVCWAAM